MSIYVYITPQDQFNWRKVTDTPLNNLFQDALMLDESLMISEHYFYKNTGFFSRKKEKVFYYNVYHESPGMMQAYSMSSASGDKSTVITYLYGIINGASAQKAKYEEHQKSRREKFGL